MALWGASDATEDSPKWLTAEQKEDCIATLSGWAQKAGTARTGNGNTSADPEILVAIRGLSGSIGTGDIMGFDWNISAFDKSDGGTLSVTANFNEAVVKTGTPQLTVTNNNRANHTLSYASGSGTNALTFTLVIGAGNSATSAGDILSIGANAMALNGGTILDNSGDRVATTQTVTSGVDTGATTFPTATLVNGSAEFATTAVLGAVTAKVVSVEVAGGGSGHAVNDIITIANSFGTGTNATYKVTAVDSGAATALEIVNAGAYTAIGGGVTGIAQQSTDGSGSSLTVNVKLGVSAVAVSSGGNQGTNYTRAPEISFAGTGLQQDNHVCSMVGGAVAITNSAAIGTAAGTITVTA